MDRPHENLRSCEAKLIEAIRNDWALDCGSREVVLVIEYEDGVPVTIRAAENTPLQERA
jgi:hypothetical protein